ncbi:FAD/FMN-containing dehydrogenase/Fe-S oxidoreductase [Lipingzhangella halophila]|uniref:FAD/FMN-containing dehydrogenase/Fe-S oxidoreductase n=1 Tax=Lipingzhangella halophila TaxID=1783352 RepID=A0A7W7RJI9_9ACTN|nr:FAD-linked oxidase C-terminal domain-containing protein [Lipingzhangella halophila]MBB4933052.1 FAD/FMN-containing dehydrogenase/Fe-S oxidoreductase [Lipingzhangella halophila]
MAETPHETSPERGHSDDLEAELRRAVGGEVRFDTYTRHMFATDASMYQITPLGVTYPRDADDVVAVVETARRFGTPVLPRGAGTSHCGQTVGEAVVLDFSRYMNRVLEVSPDERRARVQPGLVQDELNQAAAPHGLFFAPDTSTSNRATLGGMIGNNSCGSRSAAYGMTIDHVHSLEAVLADGARAHLGPADSGVIEAKAAQSGLEGHIYRELPGLAERSRAAVEDCPQTFWRRAGGYRLDRLVDGPFDLAAFTVGSEGTLTLVTEAEVALTPKPAATVMVIGHFASTTEAIAATDDAMAAGGAAIELVDNFILDLARRSPEHGHLVRKLEGEPTALLFVEFYADDTNTAEAEAGAARLEKLWRAGGHGYAAIRAADPARQQPFRALRKAGLGLLMAAGKPEERSIAFVEDTAVPPEHLAEYTTRFAEILDRRGLRAGFYGHASAGCLHVRPFMDLSQPDQVVTMREVAEEVCELALSYGGVNSSEHGDGLARSEFNERIFGPDLYQSMREVKAMFDPDRLLNPGKVVDAPPMTRNLRTPNLPTAVPLATHFDFSQHGGMRGAADRCMRIGACRKPAESGGTMCPSFMATRDEEHSTRGRANALVKALSSPDPSAALAGERVNEVLDLCLECKACKNECPMSVDMATFKSESLSAYHAEHGTPLRARIFGRIRQLNTLGSWTAPLSNLMGRIGVLRTLLQRGAGIDRRRPLPSFRRDNLIRWFRKRAPAAPDPAAGEVVFLADSFTSFTEPHIGKAAIELLEHAGWRVRMEPNLCCGRAQISKGLLTDANATARRLVDGLADDAGRGVAIVGCEPSCVATLRDEHQDLVGGDRAAAVGRQARLVEELLADALDEGRLSVADPASGETAGQDNELLFHAHCHQKAVLGTEASTRLLRHLPGTALRELDAGCCGMAGSFGFETEHYDLSMTIGGQRLFPAVHGAPEAGVCATGVSCRQQIAHGTGRQARHPVELLHEAVFGPTGGGTGSAG